MMINNHFYSTKKLTPPPFIYIYILLLTSYNFFKVSLQHFENLIKKVYCIFIYYLEYVLENF